MHDIVTALSVAGPLLALLLGAALLAALLRRGRRRDERDVVVWPGVIADDEHVALHFGEGEQVVLARAEQDGFRGRLPTSHLERPFVVCRMPGLVPEAGYHGQDVPPRSAARLPHPLWIFPAAWRDRRPPSGHLTRVGAHEDLAVTSKRVAGSRPVRVHLPAGYADEPERRYPVILLLDGQNVFDHSTAFGGVEWCLDDIAARLEAEEGLAAILVGVDNGGMRREWEYTFCPHGPSGRGGGAEEHLAFLLQEVMPLIRSRWRTDGTPPRLVGSSLGGLFALWAALAHPGEFTALAAVSPSVWWNKGAVLALPLAHGARPRVWVDMGTREGQAAGRTLELTEERLVSLGWTQGGDLRALLVGGGVHHESAWADRSPSILRFLLGGRS